MMKKRYLLLFLLSVFLFLPKTTFAATQNAKQHFRITPNDYDYTTVDSLGTFNMNQGVLFVEYIVSFTDVSVEKNKTYHAVFNYYGGLADGFYSFDSTLWSFLTDDNKTIPIYNLSMTSSGNSRNVEFDFFIPYDSKNFQLKIYNKELPVLYYSWSSSSQFGCTSVAINKIADNTDSLIKQNDIIISQNKETIEKLDDLNKTNKDTKDFLTDDTEPDSDISALGNVQGLLPPGPVDSLLNIPFQFLSVVTSSISGTCVPVSGKFVFDSTLTLPCFDELLWNSEDLDSNLMNYLSLIPATFILINYFKHLYKKVDRATSLNTNADDEWGVL